VLLGIKIKKKKKIVHAPTEDKVDDIKDRFYEELKQVFEKNSEVPYENSVRRFQ
jgi:hypothetical protein